MTGKLPPHDPLTCGLDWEGADGVMRVYCERCKIELIQQGVCLKAHWAIKMEREEAKAKPATVKDPLEF